MKLKSSICAIITWLEKQLGKLFTPAHVLREKQLREQFIRKHGKELGEDYAAEFYDKYN